MPQATSLCLGDNKLFIGPKHNIYALSYYYLVYLIWCHYLSVKFVMWIVKQKIEDKQLLYVYYNAGERENLSKNRFSNEANGN